MRKYSQTIKPKIPRRKIHKKKHQNIVKPKKAPSPSATTGLSGHVLKNSFHPPLLPLIPSFIPLFFLSLLCPFFITFNLIICR